MPQCQISYHFDFLCIGPNISGCTYVVILKDDHTNYAWLRACKNADGDSAVQAILEWCSAFGIVHDWCPDQGRHFVNLLTQSVAHELRVKQFHHRICALGEQNC
jgi:hypothetical protein